MDYRYYQPYRVNISIDTKVPEAKREGEPADSGVDCQREGQGIENATAGTKVPAAAFPIADEMFRAQKGVQVDNTELIDG